jgi:hypothetical protein
MTTTTSVRVDRQALVELRKALLGTRGSTRGITVEVTQAVRAKAKEIRQG